MSDTEQRGPRFRHVRSVGSNIRETFDTVSGRSLAEDMNEFSDAYADVLQGIHSDLEAMKRQVGALAHTRDEEANAELKRLQQAIANSERKHRIALMLAIVSVPVAVIAILIGLLV